MVVFFLTLLFGFNLMAQDVGKFPLLAVGEQWVLQFPEVHGPQSYSSDCRIVRDFKQLTSEETGFIKCGDTEVVTVKKLESRLCDQEIAKGNSPTKVQPGLGDESRNLVVRSGAVATTGGYFYYYVFADQLSLFLKIKVIAPYEFKGAFRLLKKTGL